MSVSSGPTLVSPSASTRAPTTTHTALRRHPSLSTHTAHTTHTTHTAHTHHPKRRTSSHVHATGSNAHAGSSRRPSEGDGARRAMVAGLTMNTMDGKPKRKGSGEARPLPKSSRSDTHLPRLSRQASNASESSANARDQESERERDRPKRRARPSRKKSGESVELDEEGRETQAVDSAEEGWESGEEVTGKSRASIRSPEDPMSVALRRTQSEAGVSTRGGRVTDGSALVTSPEQEEDDPIPPISNTLPPGGTTKTTGFAGAAQTLDPGAQTPAHALNDPTHVMPAHQVRHQASLRSLHALQTSETDVAGPPKTHHRAASNRSDESNPNAVTRTDSNRSDVVPRRSAESGPKLPDTELAKELRDQTASPSFPFPRLKSVSPEMPHRTLPRSPEKAKSSPLAAPPGTKPPGTHVPQPRHTSERLPPSKLKHRYSNSSLRSIQSLRLPPHPLNASTSTANNSPAKSVRGPGMHHPPIAPPVVYREVVSGQGFTIPEDAVPSPGSSRGVAAVPNGSSRTARPPRTGSFSSVASLKGALTGASAVRAEGSTSTSGAAHGAHGSHAPTPNRRRTALEAASAASKLQSTNDPALYHSSLGYPSSEAETAHLISRFLPPKKHSRPSWEITGGDGREDHWVGITSGDYREAHESLIHTMRTLGVDSSTTARRGAMSRSTSYNLLGMSSVTPASGLGAPVGADGHGRGHGESVGVVKSRNGPMVVSRGGWGGKTPFELSVERCLAQRPPQTLPGI